MSITVKPVGKGGLLRQVMSYKRFNSYEKFYRYMTLTGQEKGDLLIYGR